MKQNDRSQEGALPRVARLPYSLTLTGMCLYCVWLLVPALQVLGKAITGVAAVGLFVLGVALDTPYLRRAWKWLLAAGVACAGLPLALYYGLDRGGESLLSYWQQQGMFWYPLLFCAYVRRRGDPRFLRALLPTCLACVALTSLTTLFWLCEGYTHSPVLAYARSLGYAGASRELHERLMLRGVAGYDFLYGCVLALPLCLYCVHVLTGKRRGVALAFLPLLTLPPLLSQYLYAMIFVAVIYAVWLWGLLVRRVSRGRLGLGRSMLTALVPVALALLLRVPLSALLVRLADATGMRSVQNGAHLLYEALTGQPGAATAELPSRLEAYTRSLATFTRSPLLGTLVTGGPRGAIGYHSDALDLLACLGVLGTAAFLAVASLPGRGLLRGLRRSEACPYVGLTLVMLGLFTLLGTLFYSRELTVILSVGLLACAELALPSGEAARP